MSNRLIEKQLIYSGKKIQLEVHRLEAENGRITEREVCVHPGAVVILAFLDDGRILLIRNRRYSVGQTLSNSRRNSGKGRRPHESAPAANCSKRLAIWPANYRGSAVFSPPPAFCPRSSMPSRPTI